MGDYREKTNWLPDDPVTEDDINRWEKGIKDAHTDINQHKADHTNPHRTTKSQVGLGNVDNVKQAPKTEFDAHVNNKGNPHGVTKSQVGLGDVPNWSGASQTDARIGTNNSTIMTPLRTKEAIDALSSIQLLPKGSVPSNAGIESYPFGLSIMLVGEGEEASGYPGTWGVVKTFKPFGTSVSSFQQFSRITTDQRVFTRTSNGNGWNRWIEQETVSGSQAKVDVHANDKGNPHGTTKAQVGLGNVPNYPVSSKEQAEAGNHTASFMTPLRTKEAISALTSQATIISAIAGTVTGKDYPLGLTTFEHSNLSGYPTSHGTVLNIKISNLRFTQWYYPHSIRHEEIGAYFRHFYDSDGWTAWQKVETTAASIRRVNQTGWGIERINDGPGLLNDLNELKKSGQYYFTGASVGAPWTGNAGGTLIHLVSGNGNTYANQLAFSDSNDRVLFRRKSSGSWATWQQLETIAGAQEKVNATQVHKVTGDSGHGILLSSGTDLNKVVDTGFYRIQNPVNQPSDSSEGWAYLIVNKQAQTEAMQIYIPFVSRVIYIRSSTQTGSWREWVRQATQGELVAHTNDKGNPHNVTKSQVGLGSVPNWSGATEAEAQAGTNNAKIMTPLRTKEAFNKFSTDQDTGWITLALHSYLQPQGTSPRVRRIGNTVYLEGTFKNVLDTDVLITVLPDEFRPGRSLTFPTTGQVGHGTVFVTRIDVQSNGRVIFIRSSRQWHGEYEPENWYNLDGIIYTV
ncbi:pyocin knob domain-containing protein [Shouchella clausii]|uniref:pyocin knob domain-containing protein n=1 Tax=Shouchella clausii TaxID=79880 RepID=UPI00289C76DF|nr:pyocin knob domain-containing protein [Shouchella clausii]